MLYSKQKTTNELQLGFIRDAKVPESYYSSEKPKTAVTYGRYSSDNQREESIEAQFYACDNYAKSNGFTIINRYVDKAKSGTNDNRPDFQRMICDAKEKKFQYILVHKYDRFSRSVEDSTRYFRELAKYGVEVISVLERFGNDPEGELMRNITMAMNQFYSRNLGRDTMKGLELNARKAMHNGGKPPLGYRVNSEQTYEIEPNEAEIVKFVYKSVINGMSYTDIVKELKKLGMCKNNGKHIAPNSIYDILKNIKYTGTYIYNRSTSKDPSTNKRTNRKNKDESKIIKVENSIPPIISHEDFAKVQLILSQRKQLGGTNKASAHYLNTGLVRCKQCGEKMYGNSRQNGKKADGTRNSVRTYRCKCKSCHNEVMAEKLDEYIYRFILDILKKKSPSSLEASMFALMAEQLTTEQDSISNLQNECSILKRDIDSILDKTIRVEDDRILLKYYAMVREKEDRLCTITNQIQSLESKISNATADRMAIRELIERAPNMLKTLDGKVIQQVFKAFISKIVIDKEAKNVEIYLNLGVFSCKGGDVETKIVTYSLANISDNFKKKRLQIDYSRKEV